MSYIHKRKRLDTILALSADKNFYLPPPLKLIEAFDTDGDGNIDFEEFLKMVSPDTGDFVEDVKRGLGAFKVDDPGMRG